LESAVAKAQVPDQGGNMKTRRLLLSFLVVTVAFGLLVAALDYFVIMDDIIERAQRKIRNDLNSAREIYRQEIGRVRDLVRLTALRVFLTEDILKQEA
jgi:two-component system NtrC family sensor kinase